MELSWAPETCTLPTAEQPLRVAEFPANGDRQCQLGVRRRPGVVLVLRLDVDAGPPGPRLRRRVGAQIEGRPIGGRPAPALETRLSFRLTHGTSDTVLVPVLQVAKGSLVDELEIFDAENKPVPVLSRTRPEA